MEKEFFEIFIVTIIITRTFLYLKPISCPTILGLRLHHYMYGILIVIASLFLKNIWLYAIGLALVVDEIPFLILKGKTWHDYYSKNDLTLLTVLVIIIYFIKELVVLPM